MIRNYNGPKNRRAIIEIRRLCDVQANNLMLQLKDLKMKGKLTLFYYDSFKMATVSVVFESEKQLRDFLKNQFSERVKQHEIKGDYFIETLVNFLKENEGIFPDSKEMEKIEKEAEKLRLAATSSKEENEEVEPLQMLLIEIVQFSEEIMLKKPEERRKFIVSDNDIMDIKTEKLQGKIIWKERNGDLRDYSFHTFSSKGEEIVIDCKYNGAAEAYKCDYVGRFKDYIGMNRGEKQKLIDIHKELALLAKNAGIDFESEVNYRDIY